MDGPPPYAPSGARGGRLQPAGTTYNGGAKIWAAGDASKVAARNAMNVQSRRKSRQGTTVQKARRKSRHFAKTMRPGITVDTAVSRHRGKAPREVPPLRVVQPAARQVQPPQIPNKDAPNLDAFVSLDELKATRHTANSTKMTWWLKGLRGQGQASSVASPTRSKPAGSVTSGGLRSRTNTIKSEARYEVSPVTAGSTLSQKGFGKDISPSDRLITIGISVPSGTALTRSMSFESNERDYDSFSGQYQNTTAPPSILVTPVQQTKGWDAPPADEHRPRPASSIYSRNTFRFSTFSDASTAPPVPSIPAHVISTHPTIETRKADDSPRHASQRQSEFTDFEEDDSPKARDRVLSSGTMFEEDSPKSAGSDYGATLDAIKLQSPSQASRTSKGWWNIITTPFMDNRRFSRFRQAEPTPEVPPINTFPSPVIPLKSVWSPDSTEPNDTPYTAKATPTSRFPWPRSYATTDRAVEPVPKLGDLSRGQSYANIDDASSPRNHLPDQPRDVASSISSGQRAAYATIPQIDTFLQKSPPPITPVNNSKQASAKTMTESDMVSPRYGDSEFSPIVGVANVGTVLAPREVERKPSRTQLVPETVPKTESQPAPYFPPPPRHSRRYSSEVGGSRSSRSPIRPLKAHTRDSYRDDRSLEDQDLSRRGTVTRKPRRSRESGEKRGFGDRRARERRSRRDWRRFFGRDKTQDPRKRRKKRICCLCCCILILILIIILAAVLGTQLHKHGDDSSSNGPDLFHVDGFPPVPTGLSTIAQPDALTQDSDCVQPSTMWSCAVPKEDQDSIKPNAPNQPNFKFEIAFDKTAYAQLPQSKQTDSARRLTRRQRAVLGVRDAFEDSFNPSPAAPSIPDQNFLGNTTDGNAQPFEGEHTPFSITFFEADGPSGSLSPSRRLRRHLDRREPQSRDKGSVKKPAADAQPTTRGPTSTTDAATSTTIFPNLSTVIPGPPAAADGTALPANLLPLPSNQPLRLYDRGLPTEHYGFYTYYTRSIFLKSISIQSSLENQQSLGDVPADQNGGASLDSASVRCTWTQTRFKVQIFTNTDSDRLRLLAEPAPASDPFQRPGTFPLPASISLDRHGGLSSEKMIFCYALDDRGRVEPDNRKLQVEDRGVGGTLVNPSEGPFGKEQSPVDGGSGGCGCEWGNWERSF